MKRIIFPFILFLSITNILVAQVPVQMQPSAENIRPVLPVDPGSARTGADAGLGTPFLFPNANSTDVNFLCLGDSMDIFHSGGSLLGDPNPLTIPGYNYAWYQCAPTVSGPNWTSILNDPCHLEDPFSFIPPGITVVEPPFITPDGNTVFFNQSYFQTTYGAGGPYEVFFAPITVDDFANSDPEPDPMTLELGPCMDVNVADAFSVVYLNEITGSNFVAASCYG
ncbi:MAG: hypothetical protein HKN16_03060, partial [Saprospiraceae bacterium]|nr:hypothetical protein [Saprospiraceae bacterium]